MSRSRDVTIQEIARQAGVGVGTVSRVLNDSPNVSEATRSAVREVMAKLDYRPKAAAKTLRTRRSGSLAFITDEVASTPYAVDTIRGAQDAAWQHGMILLTVNTNNDEKLLEAAVESMLDRQVDGLLFATWYHRAAILPANVRFLPTVLIDCFVEDRSLPSVVPDEERGGYEATELLLRQGHSRVAFINNDWPQPAHVGREIGYRRALADWNRPFQPHLMTCQDGEVQGGYRGAHILFGQPEPPSALFCFNDRTAMGAYDALRELNLNVPRDVAVVSYDNQELIAANLRPGLTTLQLPHYEMGAWAVNYLLETYLPSLPSALALPPPQVKLHCPIVLRESHGTRREEVARSIV